MSDQITTLRELYESRGFEAFKEGIYGNDGWINDPERRERIENAAESGSDGSTHGEVIQDWQDYLSELEIPDQIRESIQAEIDACRKWHEENGTLDQSGG